MIGLTPPLRTRRAMRLFAPLRSKVDHALRVSGAIVLLSIAGAALYWNSAYRTFEANLAALTLAPFATGTGSSGTTFFTQQPAGMIGLQITAECTALILIAPLIVLAAVLLVVTPASWTRVGLGIAAMWVVITIANEIRLALIGFLSSEWGIDVGYPLSHIYIGSVIGILGFVGGVAALLLVTGAARRRDR